MQDYSQNGEQGVILNYFGGKRGALLDIGANDGQTLSNSRALVELGWYALLVEPAERAFAKLMENSLHLGDGATNFYRTKEGEAVMNVSRGRMFCVNAAITPQDGPVDFWDCGVHLRRDDTSLLSTTRPETLVRWKRSGEQFTKTTVRGITFDTLLKETGLSHFDFISIDCEGADWDVLRQIDLAAVGCRMLCVEVNGNDDRVFTEYAIKHGLRPHWKCYENRIYVK